MDFGKLLVNLQLYEKQYSTGRDREEFSGAVHPDSEPFLSVGVRSQYSGCAEQAFSGCTGHLQGEKRTGAGDCLWRIFSDGASGRQYHQALGIQGGDCAGAGAVRNRGPDVHSWRKNDVISILPAVPFCHRMRPHLS